MIQPYRYPKVDSARVSDHDNDHGVKELAGGHLGLAINRLLREQDDTGQKIVWTQNLVCKAFLGCTKVHVKVEVGQLHRVLEQALRVPGKTRAAVGLEDAQSCHDRLVVATQTPKESQDADTQSGEIQGNFCCVLVGRLVVASLFLAVGLGLGAGLLGPDGRLQLVLLGREIVHEIGIGRLKQVVAETRQNLRQELDDLLWFLSDPVLERLKKKLVIQKEIKDLTINGDHSERRVAEAHAQSKL